MSLQVQCWNIEIKRMLGLSHPWNLMHEAQQPLGLQVEQIPRHLQECRALPPLQEYLL